MERPTITPGFVEDALQCLHRQGFDPAPVLRQAGIDPALETPVTHLQYGRLWLAIAQQIDDEFFGEAARPMRPGSFKLLCQVVLHTDNLERALQRALRFLAVVLDSPAGELRLRDGQAEILLHDRGQPHSAFAYRTYWLILLGVLCWLIGRRIPLTRVDFACPAPANRRDYHQFFGAPVHFDQPRSCLRFAASHLALPTIRSDKALAGFLRGAPANILLGYRHDQVLSLQIRERLRRVSPDAWPSFEQLAQDLELSPTTLRRRLRSEGQGYAAIRAGLRLAQAQQLLQTTDLSVAEIATRLGYDEPSAFYRAFLKANGTTPAVYRRRLAGH